MARDTQVAAPAVTAATPKPSAGQQQLLDFPFGLSMMAHFSIATFAGTDNPCGSHGCPPASAFAPATVNATQIVATAAAMGASELCLTAHHGAGFAMWDSNYTDYGVMHSRYPHDVVAAVAAEAARQGIRMCLYFDLGDGYDNSHHVNASVITAKQEGFLAELLGEPKYGPIHRMWLDDYFAAVPFWKKQSTASFQKLSPATVTMPGWDGWYNGPSVGTGEYPLWLSTNTSDGTPTGTPGSFGLDGTAFRVREADMTIQMSTNDRGSRWFWENKHDYLDAGHLWDHWMATVGRGSNLIINVPPSIYGGVPPKYAQQTAALGAALRSSFSRAVAEIPAGLSVQCDGSSASSVNLTLPTNATWNAVVVREDLAQGGQRMASYALFTLDGTTGAWVPVPGVHGGSVGNRIVDAVPQAQAAAATAVSFRCSGGVAPGVPGLVRSFGVYQLAAP